MFEKNIKIVSYEKQERKQAFIFHWNSSDAIDFAIHILTVFEYTAVAEIRESFTPVDQTKTLAYGNVLFETRGCSSCHAIKPRQKSLGPNLFGLSNRKTMAYIRQSITNPDSVIVPGYDDVVMPNFGKILDSRQIEALAEYVNQIK